MCRSASEPCGQRRCNSETDFDRRGRQRAASAARKATLAQAQVPVPEPRLAASTEAAEWTATESEVAERIREAEQVMSETDLVPTFSRHRKDKGHAPAVYEHPERAPMRFDDEQGWEVPTEQGRRLDLAVRRVGAAIESRAMHVHRGPATLTPDQITPLRQSLRDREEAILGKSVGTSSLPASALEDALRLHPQPLATIRTEDEYDSHVRGALDHVSDALDRQGELEPGDNKPDVLTLDEMPAYEAAREALTAESAAIDAGSGSAWYMHQARLDSEARIKALGEVREMGGTYAPGFLVEAGTTRKRRPAAATRDDVRRSVESTSARFPRDWVDTVSTTGRLGIRGLSWGETSSVFTPASGGVGKPDDPSVRLRCSTTAHPYGPATGCEADALHETGHYMEFRIPEINQIARTHKAIRASSPDGRLDDIERLPLVPDGGQEKCPERMDTTPGSFGSWGRPADFRVTYASVETGPRGSEVFSTGVEATLGGRYGALSGHGGSRADPEHLNLTLGILATVKAR